MSVIPLRTGPSACAAAVEALETDELWDALNRRCAFTCEMCQTWPATELHHIAYKPVDPAKALDNLFALCRDCHTEKHGDEN